MTEYEDYAQAVEAAFDGEQEDESSYRTRKALDKLAPWPRTPDNPGDAQLIGKSLAVRCAAILNGIEAEKMTAELAWMFVYMFAGAHAILRFAEIDQELADIAAAEIVEACKSPEELYDWLGTHLGAPILKRVQEIMDGVGI
jgi:hypothetical protein